MKKYSIFLLYIIMIAQALGIENLGAEVNNSGTSVQESSTNHKIQYKVNRVYYKTINESNKGSEPEGSHKKKSELSSANTYTDKIDKSKIGQNQSSSSVEENVISNITFRRVEKHQANNLPLDSTFPHGLTKVPTFNVNTINEDQVEKLEAMEQPEVPVSLVSNPPPLDNQLNQQNSNTKSNLNFINSDTSKDANSNFDSDSYFFDIMRQLRKANSPSKIDDIKSSVNYDILNKYQINSILEYALIPPDMDTPRGANEDHTRQEANIIILND